jgi:hypothetical protein
MLQEIVNFYYYQSDERKFEIFLKYQTNQEYFIAFLPILCDLKSLK